MTTPAKSPHDPSACPSLADLQAYALGQLHGQTQTFVSHLLHCARCTARLLSLPETTAAAVEPPPDGLPDDGEPGPTEVQWAARPTPQAPEPPGRGPAPARPAALRLGRYAIQRQVGKGGFGTVYLAHDEDLARPVAVKVPYAHRIASPQQLEIYHAEARLHAALDHPHILPLYDVGRAPEAPFYLVSKFIDGESLAERLKRGRPEPRQAAAWVLALAEALDHMHRRGLVHRDVKPSNVLLDADGTPYLADFGLAIRLAPADEAASPVAHLAGTPAYMSPEQARGRADQADGRTDIYSLGVVLYELLAGQRPFSGTVRELQEQVLNVEPPPPRAVAPDVPEGLEAVCLKAMAKDAANRHQTAGQLADELRRHLGAGAEAPPEPDRRWVTALAAVGALAAVVFGAYLFNRPVAPPTGPPQPPATPPTTRAVVATRPPGASVAYVPLDTETGWPRPEALTRARAGEEVNLTPGPYLVVAALDGEAGAGRFHEVYRIVPLPQAGLPGIGRQGDWKRINGVVHLREVTLPPSDVTRGMCLLPAAPRFTAGDGLSPMSPRHDRSVPAFYLDTTEVTRGAYRRRLEGAKFKPGPADDHPVSDLSWDQVVSYAEGVGKRLPDEAEYEYAATACGRSRFPWGDGDEPLRGKRWELGPAGSPRHDGLKLPGQPTVFGLYSNVAEWTSNWVTAATDQGNPNLSVSARIVRGGPPAMLNGAAELGSPVAGPRERYGLHPALHHMGLGFRCARSARPRLTPADFGRALPR